MDEPVELRLDLDAAWDELRQACISGKNTEERQEATLTVLWQVGRKMQPSGVVDEAKWNRVVDPQPSAGGSVLVGHLKRTPPLIGAVQDQDETRH